MVGSIKVDKVSFILFLTIKVELDNYSLDFFNWDFVYTCGLAHDL